MNANQTAAVEKLTKGLTEKRGLAATIVTNETGSGKVEVLVDVAGSSWPLVVIGKQGGFGMPEIRSYRETGKGDSYQYPGETAFDAALFGDKHLERQSTGKRAPKAKATAAEGFVVGQAAALATV